MSFKHIFPNKETSLKGYPPCASIYDIAEIANLPGNNLVALVRNWVWEGAEYEV